MSPSEHTRSVGPSVVGEFGDDTNRLSRDRVGALHPQNTTPSTTGRYKLVRTHGSTPKRLKNQKKGVKRVGREVEHGGDPGGRDVVELLSSQEPSPASRRNASQVVDLTRDEGEFEMISCTVKKTPVRRVRTKVSPRGVHAGPQHMALSATLQMIMGNRKQEEEEEEEGTGKSPQCGICFEAMGKNTEKPMAAGNCGHVYCKPCLARAVKERKKCPGCSAKMTGKQIRNIFFDV